MLNNGIVQSHINECNRYAQANPDQFVKTVAMVLLSIRQPWHFIGNQLKDVEVSGADSKYLFSFKKTGYQYAIEHKYALHSAMLAADNAADLLDLFTTIPGLGLVKAGFLVQLCRGWTGCIDTHNAKLYDISPGQLRLDPKLTAKTRRAKIVGYVALCEGLGGSRFLWKQWCEFVAARHPTRWTSSNAVSLAHVTYNRG